MKPVDAKSSTCINSSREINDRDSKFKVGDIVRISTCKNFFGKCCFLNWSEEVFVIKKVKNAVPWTYAIFDLKGEEIVETFLKKYFQKTNQKV